jgi:hypothetical protein
VYWPLTEEISVAGTPPIFNSMVSPRRNVASARAAWVKKRKHSNQTVHEIKSLWEA